jgi:tetratricopeptide (TPR) repeat protein
MDIGAARRKYLPRDVRDSTIALIIVAIAASVRICALLLTYSEKSFFTKYLTLGKQLWQNNLLTPQPFSYSPIYCYFLAFAQAAFGDSLFCILLIQCLVGSLTCVMIFFITRHLLNTGCAIVATVIACFYRSLVVYDVSFLSDAMGVAFMLLFAAVLYFEGKRIWFWIIPGAVLGLCILQRQNSLLLVPCILFWWFLKRESLAINFKKATVTLSSMLLVILPIILQNMALTGKFSVTYGNPGFVFYSSNNYSSLGFRYSPPPLLVSKEFRGETNSKPFEGEAGSKPFIGDMEIATDLSSGISGREMSMRESSDFYFEHSFRYLKNYPLETITLLGRKLWLTFNGYEAHDTLPVFVKYRQISAVTPFAYWLIAPLGIVGLFLSLGEWRKWFPLYFVLINQVVLLLLFYVIVRYRLPIEAVSIILSVLTLQRGYHYCRNREWKKMVPVALAIVFAAFLCNTMDAEMREAAKQNYVANHFMAGEIVAARGNYSKAIAFFEDVLDKADEHSRYAAACRRSLARIYKAKGLDEKLIAELSEANLSASEKIGSLEEEVRSGSISVEELMKLALLYEWQGEPESALAAAQKAHLRKPSHPIARYHLGRFQNVLGDTEQAERNLEIALREGLLFSRFGMYACFHLAEVNRRRNDRVTAEKYYRQAARQTIFLEWGGKDRSAKQILRKLRSLGYLPE